MTNEAELIRAARAATAARVKAAKPAKPDDGFEIPAARVSRALARKRADAYAAFEEARALGPAATTAAGKRYLQEILSVGGSRPALESFTAFRGREPSIDALLRHSGMAARKAT